MGGIEGFGDISPYMLRSCPGWDSLQIVDDFAGVAPGGMLAGGLNLANHALAPIGLLGGALGMKDYWDDWSNEGWDTKGSGNEAGDGLVGGLGSVGSFVAGGVGTIGAAAAAGATSLAGLASTLNPVGAVAGAAAGGLAVGSMWDDLGKGDHAVSNYGEDVMDWSADTFGTGLGGQMVGAALGTGGDLLDGGAAALNWLIS